MKLSTGRTVIILNDYCNINGGASRIAIDEAVCLARAGENVIFLGAVGPVCDELANAPLQVRCLGQNELLDAGKNPAVLLQGLWNMAACRAMETLLATLEPASTIVHLHGYTKALTTSPVRAAVKGGFSVVCTLHDFFTACPNGAFFDYPVSKPCPRRGLSFDCITANCDKRHYTHKLYRVARSVVQKTAGLLPQGVKHYIPLSNRSLEILKPYLPADAQYHPLENLIRLDKTAPVEVTRNKTVVAVGRLDIEKGIEILLEAAQLADVNLTLVGDGPLRARAESYGNCRVTGWVSPETVYDELAKARALAFPSIWYEAYGLVVAEAAARGVPSIVSTISAASERVEDGIHGWHVAAGDVQSLARALAATKDDAIIAKAGLAAYERFWKAPPTELLHTAGLQAIYGRILNA
jgi:glycosyltransferase involved in cell wall biosynthesis